MLEQRQRRNAMGALDAYQANAVVLHADGGQSRQVTLLFNYGKQKISPDSDRTMIQFLLKTRKT
jgi:hypothetical protein